MYKDHRHKIENNNPVRGIFIAVTPKYQIQASYTKTVLHIAPTCRKSADIY
jgi:hypothetical protein